MNDCLAFNATGDHQAKVSHFVTPTWM